MNGRVALWRRTRGPILIAALTWALPAWGDEEASNRIYLTTSQGGQFYARSIPAESWGSKGRTEIYQVGAKDTLLHTYDWYSPQVYLEGSRGGSVHVVQMGPWHRGREANERDLALAIYQDGKLLKKHSTLAIAGAPGNVSASMSHYVVFEDIKGFQADRGGFYFFEAEAIDRKRLRFDVETGQILTDEQLNTKRLLSEAGAIIGNLKYKWYESNQALYERNKKILLTRKMLMAVSGGDFPPLPAGYEYVPGEVWGPPEFRRTRK